MDDSLTSINVGHGDARRVEVVHISTILIFDVNFDFIAVHCCQSLAILQIF